jgi:hypothetical protein
MGKQLVSFYKPITNTAWVRARLLNYKKGALDSQPQLIKFTSCPWSVVLFHVFGYSGFFHHY